MPADNFLWIPKAAVGGLMGTHTQPQGESTDEWFSKKGAFEVLSFSFGVTQGETSGSGSTGAGIGRAKFDEFQIEKFVDRASVPLFNCCAAGAHFPDVLLAVRKPGGSNLLYLQYIFRMVFVTNIGWSGGGGDETPKETIKFKFGAMGIQYVQQDAKGQPMSGKDGRKSASWSTVTNKNELTVPGLEGAPDYLAVRQGG
jgi:type VI secretion system secreted protein Hcp